MLLTPFAAYTQAEGTSSAAGGTAAEKPKGGPVFIIPVDQEIERGLQSFLERGFEEAAKYGAVLIVLEIDTPGGLVDSAEQIGQMVRDSEILQLLILKEMLHLPAVILP